MASSIVCALDSSTHRRAVAQTALKLAAGLGLEPVFVHVAEDPAKVPPGGSAARERARHSRLERAHASVDALVDAEADKHAVTVDVRIGEAATEVLRAADEHDAEFIVVGSRGRGRFRSLFAPSVAKQVVDGSSCPVVIVPPSVAPGSQATALAGDSVVCGVGGSATRGPAVRGGAGLARALGLELVLVQADWESVDDEPPGGGATQPPATLARAASLIEPGTGRPTARMETAPAHLAIAQCAADERAALVVLGSGDAPLSRRSTTLRVLRGVAVPVVVVPDATLDRSERVAAQRLAT